MVTLDDLLSFEASTHFHTRTETEKQVKSSPGAVFRGYTVAEGGRNAAERAWEEHVETNQSEGVVSTIQEAPHKN